LNSVYFDPSEKKFTHVRTQDVEDIIENNKRLQNTPQDHKAVWRHTSTIPNIFYDRWLNEEWEKGNRITSIFSEEFGKVIQRKLSDPDWRFLRTDNPSNPFYIGWRK
jgi:trehalose utilization protein